MEKKLYRLNLEQVLQAFGDKQLIRVKDAAEWMGVDERQLRAAIPPKKCGGRYFVSAAQIASFLS